MAILALRPFLLLNIALAIRLAVVPATPRFSLRLDTCSTRKAWPPQSVDTLPHGISPRTSVAQMNAGGKEEIVVEEGLVLQDVPSTPKFLDRLADLTEQGLGSVVLVTATAISLALANNRATSAAWLGFWTQTIGPHIGSHALSVRGWINEGLMAVFFFVVGLEIKQELRIGALASVRKALLPCIAALGGMVVPMLVYALLNLVIPGGSFAAVTVPMATDIAFAMAIFGFFRNKMPVSASAFLLTLATVDDLGAILVLATCFAKDVSMPFLGASAAIVAALTGVGRTKNFSDMKVFSAGGFALWYCLLRAGVCSDIAGVLAALCVSTQALVRSPKGPERVTDRVITKLAPFSTFFIMPLFALCNTAVRFGGGAAAAAAANVPALGITLGLLLGKPIGIFGFTWLSTKLGFAEMPEKMNNKHLGIVGILGGIGFTMCLLLIDVSLPAALHAAPKLGVLVASGLAAGISSILMSMLPAKKATPPATES